MPNDSQFTELFAYVIDLVATQNVLLKALRDRGADPKSIDDAIQAETMRLYGLRPVTEFRAARNPALLSQALESLKDARWK